MREDQLNQLQALLYKWRAEAMKGVPDAYRSRGMAYKYLRGDNYEGGLCACADEIEEMLGVFDEPGKAKARGAVRGMP